MSSSNFDAAKAMQVFESDNNAVIMCLWCQVEVCDPRKYSYPVVELCNCNIKLNYAQVLAQYNTRKVEYKAALERPQQSDTKVVLKTKMLQATLDSECKGDDLAADALCVKACMTMVEEAYEVIPDDDKQEFADKLESYIKQSRSKGEQKRARG